MFSSKPSIFVRSVSVLAKNNIFKKSWGWIKTHLPSKRRIIQLYAALLTNANIKGFVSGDIYRGDTKVACTPGLNCYSCPGAVAACPLGALQNAMASSGTTTPYYILGILALFGIIFARTICGFFCPVGLGQELLYKIKTPKLKKSRYTRLISYLKYILLIVLVIAIPILYEGVPAFCKYVCPAGTFEGSVGLLSNSANADYFSMLDILFSWKFVLLVIFVVGSIFIYRVFCRFICPLGAIYGFFNKYALIGVKLDDKKCIDCGLCIQTCKMDINKVGDHECINCGECIPVCPTKAISWKGSQIFVKGNTVDATPVVEKSVNLLAIGSNSKLDELTEVNSVNLNGELSAQKVEIDNGGTSEKVEVTPLTELKGEAVGSGNYTTKESNQSDLTKSNTATVVAKPLKTKKRGRNFWLEVAAWSVAVAVLIGALVYYNALAPTSTNRVYSVGDHCPDITLQLYNTAGSQKEDGEYYTSFSTNFSDKNTVSGKDKVMVINYWYTTCDPCVAEIPYFNQAQIDYGDDIVVVSVHANNGTNWNAVQKRIDEVAVGKESWTDYQMIFAQDNDTNTYETLGGRGAFPMTVIIDTAGKITFVQQGAVEESRLFSEIEKALSK